MCKRRAFSCYQLLFPCALSFEKDDAHVFSLLMYHLGFSKDTFDSSIYILGHTVSSFARTLFACLLLRPLTVSRVPIRHELLYSALNSLVILCSGVSAAQCDAAAVHEVLRRAGCGGLDGGGRIPLSFQGNISGARFVVQKLGFVYVI